MDVSDNDRYVLDQGRAIAAFNRAAPHYEAHATLQNTVAERLQERLELFKIAPSWILDVGGGTGWGARQLTRRFKRARVVLCDPAFNMLLEAHRRGPRFWSRQHLLCARAESLPLADGSVDMVYSNLSLQWFNDLDGVFGEFKRVLSDDGLVLFSTFGPDTLKELRQSWATVDDQVHVHAFMDMHDIGDALVRAGLSSPVVDVEHLTVTYPQVSGLIGDLKGLGATNASHGRPHSLLGRRSFRLFCEAYERFRCDGLLPATYEVIYGHAWVPAMDERKQDGSTVATFPIAEIGRRGLNGVDG